MNVMKKVGDILDEQKMKERPFDLPVSYFEGLDERISSKIGRQEKGGRLVGILKPAALLACSFVFVLLMGYGVMTLTRTSSNHAVLAVDNVQAEDLSEGDELADYIAQYLSIEDIHEYLLSEDNNPSNQ